MSIVRQIVNRFHLDTSNAQVIKGLAEHMREGRKTWRTVPRETRRAMMREAIATHTANRELYETVIAHR